MTTFGWELLFNAICLSVALSIGGFMIFMFRKFQPKFFGLLIWAFFLTLGAALTYGLYSSLLDSFQALKSSDPVITAAGVRLADNMKLLSFVVPGLMLGVAVNLITAFLQAPSRGAQDDRKSAAIQSPRGG